MRFDAYFMEGAEGYDAVDWEDALHQALGHENGPGDLRAIVDVTPTASPWHDDLVQFPRLLAEIVATQDNLDVDALCESMDLTREQLDELFERANTAWEAAKERR